MIAFMTANYVARETGYAMHGWGHGDQATHEAFAPIYLRKRDAGGLAAMESSAAVPRATE